MEQIFSDTPLQTGDVILSSKGDKFTVQTMLGMNYMVLTAWDNVDYRIPVSDIRGGEFYKL